MIKFLELVLRLSPLVAKYGGLWAGLMNQIAKSIRIWLANKRGDDNAKTAKNYSEISDRLNSNIARAEQESREADLHKSDEVGSDQGRR